MKFRGRIWKTVTQIVKNMARATDCDVSGANLQSCKVMRAIQNVHDQPESLRMRPTTVNLSHPVEFKTISHPWILGARQHQPRLSHPRFFGQFFDRPLDNVPVRILISDFHHQIRRKKKSTRLEIPDFRSCVMIYLGRENDGHNKICLGVRFALCKTTDHDFRCSFP